MNINKYLYSRTLIAISIGAVFILFVATIRPLSVTEVREDRFWVSKLQQEKRYDIVLAGDSRVYHGLDPATIEKTIEGSRVYNFAFGGCAFEERYLMEIGRLLDDQSNSRTIVLGVSPLSLTPYAAHDNRFLRQLQMSNYEMNKIKIIGDMLNHFKPILTYLKVLLTEKRNGRFVEYHDNGWVASNYIPNDENMALPQYVGIFNDNKVSTKMINVLVSFVRRWASEGVAVYAFRMPTSGSISSLENELSGYDEQMISSQIESAGGKWLVFDNSKYISYSDWKWSLMCDTDEFNSL